MMIQPIDVLPDGRQNMCDGCPDVTAHDGQIVWSCRLEEYRQYGGLVSSVPKAKGCSIASSCGVKTCGHSKPNHAADQLANAPSPS